MNFGGEKETAQCLTLAAQARRAGIRTEIYPDSAKMKKQMSYAADNNIPFVALIGEDEAKSGTVTLKNMERHEQNTLTPEEMISKIKESLS